MIATPRQSRGEPLETDSVRLLRRVLGVDGERVEHDLLAGLGVLDLGGDRLDVGLDLFGLDLVDGLLRLDLGLALGIRFDVGQGLGLGLGLGLGSDAGTGPGR